MVPARHTSAMAAIGILIALVVVGLLAVKYGKDSTPVEHGYHRRNL